MAIYDKEVNRVKAGREINHKKDPLAITHQVSLRLPKWQIEELKHLAALYEDDASTSFGHIVRLALSRGIKAIKAEFEARLKQKEIVKAEVMAEDQGK
jgi:hypothetical protein